MAELGTVLTALAQPPEARPAAPLPDTARAISGKTYLFEPNPAGVERVRLEFVDAGQAALYLTLEGADQTWPIGLDGSYRLSSNGQGMRGYWADQQTFVLEIFDIGLDTIRFRFEDDRVRVSSSELGLQLEGRAR